MPDVPDPVMERLTLVVDGLLDQLRAEFPGIDLTVLVIGGHRINLKSTVPAEDILPRLNEVRAWLRDRIAQRAANDPVRGS
jgi:hypothetical protein